MDKPRKRSFGPCFVIVCDDTGHRANHNIMATLPPSIEDIRAIAHKTVQQCINAYGKAYHWELAKPDPAMTGPLRGQAALAQAKRIILDDPADSAGKRFLLALEDAKRDGRKR